ncbi:MAG: glycosyltransferase family protein [Nitrososphaerales archaeon]
MDIDDYEEVHNFSNYDILLLCTPWRRRSEKLDKMITKILEQSSCPTIGIIDDSDDPFIRNLAKHPKVSAYFKREFIVSPSLKDVVSFGTIQTVEKLHKIPYLKKLALKGSRYLPYLFAASQIRENAWTQLSSICSGNHVVVHPLPITYLEQPSLADRDRIYDLSFIGTRNNRKRVKLARFLNRLSIKHNLSAFINLSSLDDPIPYDQYKKIIMASKLSITLRGRGRQTYRFWEIPALGTALVAEDLDTVVPNNFVDGFDALYFKTFAELEEKLLRALRGELWPKLISNASLKLARFHKPVDRARYILNVLDKANKSPR